MLIYFILLVIYIIILLLVSLGFILIETHKNVNDDIENNYRPRTLVMIPCRGVDYSLEENLKSIINQDYPDYHAVTIVDSPDDPACSIINKLKIDCIVSDFQCGKCSGKVRALCTAIEKYPDYEVYVIADSDILVSSQWLKYLIMPLGIDNAGISTTFPYFKPVGGFWSRVKEVWGFVGMGLMEAKLTRFGWGGSLAFKKSLLNNYFDYFCSNISDDTALTKIAKDKNLDLYYVKRAMPVVNSPENFEQFFEWANRQTALSIAASKKIFYYGILFYFSYMFLFFSAIFAGIFYNKLFLLFLIPEILYILNMIRRLNKVSPENVIAAILMPFIYTVNLFMANRMKNITWRGRVYNIKNKKLL
ncbi:MULTISPECIES: glycosyltransferase family 2 protein [Acidiplasma]|jgi:cellulose synthase/poly-beta-1,6-N-acetylglucosamine synthase-like glycosyltransferase|uniref:Glycosyl transferase n=1 Tax=Acidiplasma aeolicum TaxID=507754 RepID=A0A0P9CLS8_9ARCH|nr:MULTISPECIES: glycosyltransferase family 2 protein [Acidiplasma]KJE49694.1 glycosyl transferase [Acidiplasma sp. MBA-1]KPV46443.1 glycosyl transferase [Acidiplasma aeolicum]KQB34169.1 glycosyl transferase [Acidiplasma aeolicum]WMT55632.1 MAG: glycosyltransferase family 2 protein [Acidiplasma sp.]